MGLCCLISFAMFVQIQIHACEGIRNNTFVANKLTYKIHCKQDFISKVANRSERNISVVPNNLFEDTRDYFRSLGSDVRDHFFWSEYRVNWTRFHSLGSEFSLS